MGGGRLPAATAETALADLRALNEVPPLPTRADSNSTTAAAKGSNLAHRVCTVWEQSERHRGAAVPKPCCLLGPGCWGSMRYQELRSPGEEGAAAPGRRVWRKDAGHASGLLVTQSEVVLHFISKEVPVEDSVVFKNGGFHSPQGWQWRRARVASL